MKRADLIALAQQQLEGARNYRRKAVRCALEGDLQHARAFWSYARHCLLAARSFQRDAHTENYDRLRLRGRHATDVLHDETLEEIEDLR